MQATVLEHQAHKEDAVMESTGWSLFDEKWLTLWLDCFD